MSGRSPDILKLTTFNLKITFIFDLNFGFTRFEMVLFSLRLRNEYNISSMFIGPFFYCQIVRDVP